MRNSSLLCSKKADKLAKNMALEHKELEKIARLAHLQLTEDEADEIRDKLSSILEYVDRLKEVDTSGVEATAHISGVKNILREDVVDNCDEDIKKALLDAAPSLESGQLKVKAVFK